MEKIRLRKIAGYEMMR